MSEWLWTRVHVQSGNFFSTCETFCPIYEHRDRGRVGEKWDQKFPTRKVKLNQILIVVKLLTFSCFQRINAECREQVEVVVQRSLGLVKFIGELYLQHLLTARIVHECIKKLIPVNWLFLLSEQRAPLRPPLHRETTRPGFCNLHS